MVKGLQRLTVMCAFAMPVLWQPVVAIAESTDRPAVTSEQASAQQDVADTPDADARRKAAVRENGGELKNKAARSQATSRTRDQDAEKAALALVKLHLPELQGLLDRLRANEPRQYNRAITDLARSARRLEVIKNRDERLYQIEVEVLKSQQAVNLLTAKLRVRDSEPDRQRLRQALARLQQSQVRRAQYDVQLLEDRVARMQQQLEQAHARLEQRKQSPREDLEQAFSAAIKRAGRPLSAPESDADSASPRSADTTEKSQPEKKHKRKSN